MISTEIGCPANKFHRRGYGWALPVSSDCYPMLSKVKVWAEFFRSVQH